MMTLNCSSAKLKAYLFKLSLNKNGVTALGTKAWKLYNPLNGFALPNAPSEDLDQSSIGDPIMEIVLEVGDVLYMPKGIIHQALAQDEDSVHLTLSTYQRWTWGDLTSTLLQETNMVHLNNKRQHKMYLSLGII